MPKVSIIMPVFNKERYLKQTLKTIKEQKFENWELIIVNDGSTDRSRDILEKFISTDSRMKLINQENAGVSSARNTGIRNATGEWIWFIDADDVPDINFLNNAFIHMNESSSIIVGNFSLLFSNGRIEHVKIKENGFVDSETIVDLFMLYQYKNGYWGYLWNKLICRKLIIDSSIWFKEGLKLAEDLDFLVSLYQVCDNIYLLQNHAMQYTVDAINSSKNYEIDYVAQLQVQLNIYSWIIEKKNRIEYLPELMCIISRFAAYVVFYSFEKGSDYKTKAINLMTDSKIYSLLNPVGVEKTMVPIVKGLKKRSFFIIFVYLNFRFIIRKFYRILQKWGRV